jgi:hypothetical protein
LTVLLITALIGCGLDCIDKKTGESKSSQTMNESKDKSVFQFEMLCDKKDFKLDKERIFKIKNVWVENSWMYDCINNKAILKKDTSLQLIIDGEYSAIIDSADYVLMLKDNSSGAFLGGQLSFVYSRLDTFELTLMNYKNKNVIDTLKFWKT